jgi:hypothetical protein
MSGASAFTETSDALPMRRSRGLGPPEAPCSCALTSAVHPAGAGVPCRPYVMRRDGADVLAGTLAKAARLNA